MWGVHLGRQIQIVAGKEDEEMLLFFLREKNNVALFRSFSQTKETLWTDTFDSNERQYHIWNREFAWEPEYSQTNDGTKFFVAIPEELTYDVDIFSKWYDAIVRWIRKNSVGKQDVIWYLPQAWALYSSTDMYKKEY